MKPRVVLALVSSTQEFQLLQAADARSAAQRVGVELEVVFAENTAVEQIHQLYQFVHAPAGQRPAAIIVEAVSRNGMERLARNAVKAGIAWVVQESKTDYLEKLRRENPGVAVASVAVDEHEIGRIQARQFQALLPEGGAVLLVQGPQNSVTAIGRLEGLEEALRHSRIELKSALNGDWTTGSGETAVTSWLKVKANASSGVDLIGSQNDSMALGARKAIREQRAGWTRILFTGCDGLPEGGRRAVERMELAATIVKPTTAGPAIELIARTLQGQPARDVVLKAWSYPPLENLRPMR